MIITPFGRKVVRGGAWVFVTRALVQLIAFVRTIVLARLLAPNDFGLFGIALLMLSMFSAFSQTGFRQALIQKKENTDLYLNTAWTLGVIRGGLIAIVLFFGAPYVSVFFEAPAAAPILRIIGLAIILEGLTNVAVVYFEKELQFHKYFVYQLTGVIVDLTVAVSAAFILRSAWALIFGYLAGALTRCVISYVIDPYRPKISFEIDRAKELFGFGKWVLGSSILAFLILHGDDIFVGRLLGATALGLYQMAYLISNLPATEITNIVAQVTFPAYSKMQDDIPRLRDNYWKILNITTFLSFPATGLIFVLAPDFTRIFLGEKWMPMVPAIQVLVWWGGIRSMTGVNGSLFRAVKKPDIATKLSGLRLLILVILIYPLIVRLGIVGASLAVLVSSVAVIPASVWIVAKDVLKSGKSFILKAAFIPFLSTITVILLGSFFIPHKLSVPGFLSFALAMMVGYVLLAYALDKILKHGMWVNLRFLLLHMIRREDET